MTHEYWMGWFSFFMYDMERNANPFSADDEFDNWWEWDMGWWESQIEELESEG